MEFDENKNRKQLIASIRSQCVAMPRSQKHDIFEIMQWCNTHIGKKRIYHPIYEAEQGWLDYFDGEWAYSLYIEEEVHLYWIHAKEKRIEFTMRWM